jgi:hypothetical protein
MDLEFTFLYQLEGQFGEDFFTSGTKVGKFVLSSIVFISFTSLASYILLKLKCRFLDPSSFFTIVAFFFSTGTSFVFSFLELLNNKNGILFSNY